MSSELHDWLSALRTELHEVPEVHIDEPLLVLSGSPRHLTIDRAPELAAPFSAEPHTRIALTLYASQRQRPRSFLERLLQRDSPREPWLHLELRLDGRHRVRLSAKLPEPVDALPLGEQWGTPVPLDALCALALVARAHGAELLEVATQPAYEQQEDTELRVAPTPPRVTALKIEPAPVETSREVTSGAQLVAALETFELTTLHGQGALTLGGPGWKGPEVLVLRGPLILQGPLHLTLHDPVLLVVVEASDEPVELKQITLEYRGREAGPLMVVRDASLLLQACTFMRARGDDEMTGDGLHILGSSQVVLDRCRFERNADMGVEILDEARVVAVQCAFHDNGAGLRVGGRAEARVVDIEVVGGRRGVEAEGQGNLVMDGGVCRGQTEAGVVVCGEARAHLLKMCVEEAWDGLCLSERAEVAVERFHGVALRSSGIRVAGMAQVTLDDSLVEGSWHGVNVGEQALLEMRTSVAQGNRREGLAVGGKARVLARKNRFERNGAGIVVSDDARPTLEKNRCQDNVSFGLVFNDRAGGRLKGNRFKGNGAGEMAVGPHARPQQA